MVTISLPVILRVTATLILFEGDGDIDIVADGPLSFSILENVGDGTFAPFDTCRVTEGWSASGVFAADLNGDGHLDLSTGVQGGMAVLLNRTAPEILSAPSATVRADSSFVYIVNYSIQRAMPTAYLERLSILAAIPVSWSLFRTEHWRTHWP